MHSFDVHSNESSCRKKVRLGLEQVCYGVSSPESLLSFKVFFFFPDQITLLLVSLGEGYRNDHLVTLDPYQS